jgi:hypothetical protein
VPLHVANKTACARFLQHPELPMLPPNAKYLFHKNECYDWGTIGWVFSSGQVRGGVAALAVPRLQCRRLAAAPHLSLRPPPAREHMRSPAHDLCTLASTRGCVPWTCAPPCCCGHLP